MTMLEPPGEEEEEEEEEFNFGAELKNSGMSHKPCAGLDFNRRGALKQTHEQIESFVLEIEGLFGRKEGVKYKRGKKIN